jgi:hypothetical protein
MEFFAPAAHLMRKGFGDKTQEAEAHHENVKGGTAGFDRDG